MSRLSWRLSIVEALDRVILMKGCKRDANLFRLTESFIPLSGFFSYRTDEKKWSSTVVWEIEDKRSETLL
jgi:hypothetical protein